MATAVISRTDVMSDVTDNKTTDMNRVKESETIFEINASHNFNNSTKQGEDGGADKNTDDGTNAEHTEEVSNARDNGILLNEKGSSNLAMSPEGEKSVVVNTHMDEGVESNAIKTGEVSTDENTETHFNDKMPENVLPKRLLKIVDSDSEEENIFISSLKGQTPVFGNNSESDSSDGKQNRKRDKVAISKNKRRVVDSDSEDEHPTSNNNNSSNTEKQNDKEKSASYRFRTLVDSESEEEEEKEVNQTSFKTNICSPIEKSGKHKTEKKRKGSIRASKDEAMRQIHSETQRLIRESAISLPYHRPKQRTLQEFLNRKKVSASLPAASTTAAKLRISSEIISKVLEEKEKEAELFYKSSDSEEESNQVKEKTTILPPSGDKLMLPSNETISIEETQRPMKHNIQDSRNKKEIIQQGEIDIGVPRKLFGENFNKIESESTNTPTFDQDDVSDESNSNEHHKPKAKEHKHLSKDVNVSRKLFNSNFEENMDVADLEDSQNESNSMATNNINQANKTEIGETVDMLIESLEHEIDPDNRRASTNRQVENEMKEPVLDKSQISQSNMSTQSGSDVTTSFVNDTQGCQDETVDIFETPHIRSEDRRSLHENDKPAQVDIIHTNEDTDITNDKKCEEIGDSRLLPASGIKNGLSESEENIETNLTIPEGHVYGLPLPDFVENKSSGIKKKVLSQLPNIKPTLKGSPGMVINLSGEMKPNKGVNKLLDRFFSKHSSVPKPSNNNSEVTIVHVEETVDGPKAVKEILPYQPPINENEDPELSKPGVKLRRLKEDLKLRMALKRNEEWKQKEREMKELEEEFEDEISKSGIDKEGFEDEELSESDESGESEPEEDDIPINESKRKKCVFADDEAEVSENENEDSDGELNDEDNDEELDDGNTNCTDDENENEDDMDEEENVENEPKKKKLKRIITAFDDETNDADTKDLLADPEDKGKDTIKSIATDRDIFESGNGNGGWVSDNENDISVFQQHHSIDTVSQTTPRVKNNILDFVSPITQLTALNTGSNSERKRSDGKKQLFFVDDSGCNSMERTLTEKANMFEKTLDVQNKLFDDRSQSVNDEELMDLCSGKFTCTQKDGSDLFGSKDLQTDVSESQLLNICSGPFETQKTGPKDMEIDNIETNAERSKSTKLSSDRNSESLKRDVNARQNATTSSAKWNKFTVVSSDDEDISNNTGEMRKLKKRKVKKLEFSDDEDDNNDTTSEEEEDALEQENNENDQYVDYDSEENEVVVVPKKDIRKVAARYLDEEAELSESEWGSADEDEKDLDKLEYEEGDAEDIDENQVRDQLGKIHMKQILDEDQRDVRLLKELLFEDGDLHSDGGGRERKFKWRNIDKMGETDSPQPEGNADGWVDVPEDENELEWRKFRHERQKFLETQKKDTDDEEDIEGDLGDSQIFKLGMKVLKKNSHLQKQDVSISATKSVEPIIPRNITDLLAGPLEKKSNTIYSLMQKRSLLSRGEESLARIALLAKQNESASIIPIKAKNFVFAHISPSVKDDIEEAHEEDDDNEKLDTTNKHRKRKAAAGGTPRTAKKAKVEGSCSSGKKLFE